MLPSASKVGGAHARIAAVVYVLAHVHRLAVLNLSDAIVAWDKVDLPGSTIPSIFHNVCVVNNFPC